MPTIALNSRKVDLETGEVSGPQGDRLTPRELALLRYLVERSGEAVARDVLSTEVFGYHPNARTRAVDKAMFSLRTKVERDPATPDHLQTLQGVGYRFVPALAEARVTAEPAAGALVGRDEDLASVEAALSLPVVSVVGPGGVGKSRLAATVASRLASAFAGRVWWCDLSSVSHADFIVPQLASAVGQRLADADAVGAWLARQGAGLVVLDEADALTEPLAALLARWSAAAPLIRFLVTSRELLPGASCQRLEPLRPADAAQLLLQRIVALGGQLAVGDEALVPDLVRRLDGLPLGLELAAHPLATTMSPAELLRHLHAHHALPVVTRVARTLPATVAFSWSLLDEELRSALVALVAVPGSVAADGAAAAFGVDAHQALGILAALRRRSLLATLRAPSEPDRSRFRPYESVRDFVLSLGLAGERATAWARYRRWLLARGDEVLTNMDLGSPGQRFAAAERVGLMAIADDAPREPDAAMTALRLLEGVWLNQQPSSYRRALEQTLAAGRGRMERESELFGEAMACFTAIRGRLGNELAQLAQLEAVVERLQLQRDPPQLAVRLWSRYTIAAFELADSRKAADGALRALRDWGPHMRDITRAGFHNTAGNGLRALGDRVGAEEHYRLVLQCAGEDGALVAAAAWANLGLMSPPQDAVTYLRRALALMPPENHQAESPTRVDFANALAAAGALDEARSQALTARHDARAMGRPTPWFRANTLLVQIDRELGRPDEAVAWLDEVAAQQVFDRWWRVTEHFRASLLLDLDRTSEAAGLLERVATGANPTSADTRVMARASLAVALARCGRFDAARGALEMAAADPSPAPLDAVRALVLPRYALAIEAEDPSVDAEQLRRAHAALPPPILVVTPYHGLDVALASRWVRDALARRGIEA